MRLWRSLKKRISSPPIINQLLDCIEDSNWISKDGIGSGILVSVLTSMAIFLLFSHAWSPLTSPDLQYDVNSNLYGPVEFSLENEGEVGVENLTVRLSSPVAEIKNRSRNYTLNPGDQETTYFRELEFKRSRKVTGNDTIVKVNDYEQVRDSCGRMDSNSSELISDDRAVNVTQRQFVKITDEPTLYKIRMSSEEGAINETEKFYFPPRSTTSSKYIYSGRPARLVKNSQNCKINGFSLSEFEDDIKRIHYRVYVSTEVSVSTNFSADINR